MIEDKDIDTVMRRIDVLQEKVNFEAFEKSKINIKKVKEMKKQDDKTEEDEGKELMRKQSDIMEAEIKKITSFKLGRCGKVFKMRELVAG